MGYPSRKYRVGAYRRRNWQNIVIIALAIALVLLIAFLIIGNRLNSRSENADSTEKTKKPATTQNTPAQSIPLDYSVNGYALNIEGITESNFSDAVGAISLEGVNAVSVNFTSQDGALLYSSEVAKSLGYQQENTELISASKLCSSAKAKGFFVSGYITVNSQCESDGKISAVRRSYEAAIACELIEKGVRDVVIRCDDLSAKNIDALVALGEAVKDINSEANVGIALNKELLSLEESAMHVDKLKKAYRFICLDLSDAKDADISDYVGSSVSENQLYILRDNIRILLPNTDDETLGKLKNILASNNVSNWQVINA